MKAAFEVFQDLAQSTKSNSQRREKEREGERDNLLSNASNSMVVSTPPPLPFLSVTSLFAFILFYLFFNSRNSTVNILSVATSLYFNCEAKRNKRWADLVGLFGTKGGCKVRRGIDWWKRRGKETGLSIIVERILTSIELCITKLYTNYYYIHLTYISPYYSV